MVKLNLRWSREHAFEFCSKAFEQLSNDRKSEYFNVTFDIDGCTIQIENGVIRQ